MSNRHLLLLVGLNAAWGWNFIAGKIGTQDFGPLLFSAIRFAVVLVLLFPFLRIVKGQMKLILLIGFCLGAGHYSLMFTAMYIGKNISAVAIASQLTVPFSTILAVVFLKETVGLTRIFAITMSFLGVLIISFEPIGFDHAMSLVLATLASFVLSVAAILMRRLNNVAVFNLQAWIAVVSTISLSLLAWVIEEPNWQVVREIPLQAYWNPVYSAIGATIFGHGSLYYLLQRYPVSSIAPLITLATLFAIVFGVVFMDDILTTRIVIGGLVTLLGVTVIAYRNARTSTPSSIRVPR